MRRSPKETEEAAWLVTRRGVILGCVQVGFMAALGLRMRQMQVKEADSYRLLAEENRINVRLIPPSRGIIYDRQGIEIARNAQNYRVVIVREDDEYPGWFWCVNAAGLGGWLPYDLVTPEGKVLKNYNTMELTVGEGVTVEAYEEMLGWTRVRRADGVEGWIPSSHLAT